MRSPSRSRSASESGLTLIEMLVSLSILAVVFSGFAAVLIGAIGGVIGTENETRATAIATEAIEQLQAADWDFAALYESEVVPPAADARWLQRLDEEYAGLELVELPGPAAGGANRLPQVPAPTSTVTDPGNVVYTVDRYVFWVDRDGDGDPETKRFVAHVTWESRGRPREISLASERIPTVAESPATAIGARILQMWVSHDPASLDDQTGRNVQDLTFVVRLNRNVTSGELAYFALDAAGEWELHEEPMTPVLRQEVGPPGYTRWTYTIAADSEVFANGTTTARFTALDENLNVVEGFVTVTYRNGPVPAEGEPDPGAPPQPPTTVGPTTPTPFPELEDPPDEDGDTEDDGNGDGEGENGGENGSESGNGSEGDVKIDSVTSTGEICVNSAGHYRGNFQLIIRVEGLTEDDGTVNVLYEHVTSLTAGGSRITRATVTDSAEFDSVLAGLATYEFSIPGSRRFEENTNVSFDVRALNSTEDNDGWAGVGPHLVVPC